VLPPARTLAARALRCFRAWRTSVHPPSSHVRPSPDDVMRCVLVCRLIADSFRRMPSICPMQMLPRGRSGRPPLRRGSRFHRGCLSSGVSQSFPFHPHNTHFIEGSIVPCPPPDPGAGPDAEGPPGSSRRSGGWMQPSRHGSDDSDPDSQLTVMTVSQVYNIPNPNLTLTQPLPRPRLSANCDAGIPDIITLTLI